MGGGRGGGTETAGLAGSLRAMWEAGEELDVWLESSEGERLAAHRLVLSATSDYVRALFRPLWSPPSEGRHLLLRTDSPKEALVLLLRHVYHGRLPEQLPSEMIQPLVALADQWGMGSLLKELAGRLLALGAAEKELLVPLWRLARFYPSLGLEAGIRQRLLFVMEGLGEQVTELTLDELSSLLDDDWLRVSQEEGVWTMARRWLGQPGLSGGEVEAGEQRLAGSLRLGLCASPQLLEEVRRCRRQQEKRTEKDQQWRECQDLVLALGGWSHGAPTAVMETLGVGQLSSRLAKAPAALAWARAGLAERPLAYHGVALLGEHMYVVGGFDGSEYYNSVRRWDLGKEGEGGWEALACMTVARCYVSVCAVTLPGKEEVWACGGFDGRSRLASCERYDVGRNQWSLLPPMAAARSDAAAVFFQGRLYVLGGFDGQSVLSTAEFLDPGELEKGWRPAPSMLSPRSGLSAVADPEGVLVAGGFDGEQRLASASLLVGGSWEPLPSMAQPRSNFALLSLGPGAVLAVGGYSGLQTVSTCELLLTTPQFPGPEEELEEGELPRDCASRSWLPGPPMSLNRSALKAVLLPASLSSHRLRSLAKPTLHQ